MAKTVWCLYYIQNEPGESLQSPNAFAVEYQGKRPVASDVWNAFPLREQAPFHFRFRLRGRTQSGAPSYEFADLLRPDDEVPLIADRIHCKVLNMSKLSCTTSRLSVLQRRSGTLAGVTATLQAPRLPATPRPATAQTPAATAPAATGAGAGAGEQEEDLDLFGDGAAGAGGPVARGGRGEPPADLPPVAPEDIPDDLMHIKDPAVVARILWRRSREQADRSAKEAEYRARLAADEQRQRERDVAKGELRQKMELWAGVEGARRPVRVLLSSLQAVLWPEAQAKWKPIPLAQLVQPAQVKKGYYKAIRIVHTDKVTGDASTDWISSEAFHHINRAYDAFRKEEGV